MKNCKECTKAFELRRKWQKFCSIECRNKWHWDRIKGIRIAHKYKAKMKGYDKVVFVTHQPPYGTKIDKVYGHFAGNKSFTGFIKETQPILAISGHLHETAGKKDMIGKTLVINPGPKGTLIKLVD